MKIILSPMRRDDSLIITKSSDTLTINNEVFDFSVIPEGSSLPSSAVNCEWLVGDISRTNGELTLTIILPHGPDPREDQAFPVAIENVPDGEVALPANAVVEEPTEEVVQTQEESSNV